MNKIKKFATIFAAMSLILSGTLVASAQTTTSSSSISVLEALIQSLQAQVNALIAKLEGVSGTSTTTSSDINTSVAGITGTLKIISQLQQGSSGNDVKLLQETLAADPSVYPEGIVSGYYGPLTAKAVKAYQKKHHLKQNGVVGSSTLQDLDKDLNNNPIGQENSGDGSSTTNCAIVPPGHFIAPGWLKHHGNQKPILPECQTLPPGIGDHGEHGGDDGDHQTSTPSTTPPVISSLTATGVTVTTADITWTTNEAATSTVWYGTSNPLIITGGTSNAASNAFVLNHDTQLTGLAANTTYYYVVASTDASGNVATSGQGSFTTLVTPDTTPPVISGVSATSIASSTVHIVWATNEAATSKVNYSTSTVNLLSSPNVTDGTLVLNHDLTISGLNASTTYFYVVSSADASANTATSTQGSFTTTP